MSVHDALQAWQRGELATSDAIRLSSAVDIAELEVLCRACGVEAFERGRAQIAAGEWEDMDDVIRDVDEIAAGRMGSPMDKDS